MTCQVYDGDRNRVFYSTQPVAAGSDNVDNAYDFYLKNVQQSGIMGDINKSQGNCNWEPTRGAAAIKGAAFVKHFVSAGANPFPDRYIPDPYLYHISVSPAAPTLGSPTAVAHQPAPVPPKAPVPAATSAASISDKAVVNVNEAAGGTCRVEVRSTAGFAEAKITMEAGSMKGMQYLIIPSLMSAPGKGPAKSGLVLVHFDMKISSLETSDFDGLGVRLTFPENTVTGPIDLKVTVGSVVLTRRGLTASENGSYSIRMGGGPLDNNETIKALDKAKVVEVLAMLAGKPDQLLVYADVPIGSPEARDALTKTALDAVEKRAKDGC
jgi:hypothetical protein